MKDLKIYADIIEDAAKEQIDLLLSQEAFKDAKVRIMPDVHAGKGCVIGFTADLGDKVIPNIVGVDIGCGMYVQDLGQIDIDFQRLDRVIKQNIPSGLSVRNSVLVPFPLRTLRCFKYLENVERLEDEKRQTEAEIQRLSEKSFAIKEKVICDFERFNELSFEQKRAVANAIIKKIYVSKDKLEIIWNI
jgi:uncharacterized membrane protein (Fun14 family)